MAMKTDGEGVEPSPLKGDDEEVSPPCCVESSLLALNSSRLCGQKHTEKGDTPSRCVPRC